MKKTAYIAGTILLLCGSLSAQDIPFIMGRSSISGFRAAAMGGAFIGVADDYSAAFYNPAGLGQINKMMAGASLSQLSVENSATFGGIETTESTTYTSLNSFGIAIPAPTYQGSLVFGINYQKIREFDNSLFVSAVNNAPGDSVRQGYDEMEEGHLSAISFSGALEVAPKVYLGGSLNFWTGKDDYLWRFNESDDVYDIWTFSQYHITTTINTSYSGFNLTAGMLYYLTNNIRFGLTAETPLTLRGKEDWSYTEKTLWDDNVTTQDSTDEGFYEYKISSPFKFRAGLSIKQGPILIAGSAELIDYSQMRFKDTEYSDNEEQNLSIRQTYRSVTNLAVGGELALPGTPVIIRGGYRINKSPFKHDPSARDRKIMSAGAEFVINSQFSLAGVYQSSSWENSSGGLIDNEDITYKKISMSIIYRGE